jgi:hypothetical protein
MNGKDNILLQLRMQAADLRHWMIGHTSPDTRAKEFCRIANEYAILCVRISTIEKQW